MTADDRARCARALSVCLAIGAWALVPCLSQTVSSTVIVSVRTTAGQPVIGAGVQARSAATGQVRQGLTDVRGACRLESLAPGEWLVEAADTSGTPVGRQTVALALQQTLRIEFTALAPITETAEVTARTSPIEPERTWSELRIDEAVTNELPINNRTVTDLALLDSSVITAPPGNFFGERAVVFAVNGQSGRSNVFLVDGLDNSDRISATTLNSYFSQSVIKEFVVLTRQYSPEFGRAGGGVLNIITERGSNDTQGEVFLQGSSADWNSAGDFAAGLPGGDAETATPSRVLTGFKVGGPLDRDKAHYFVAAEYQASDDVLTYTGIDRDGQVGGLFLAPNRGTNVFLRTDFNLGAANTLMVRVSGDDRTASGVNVGGIFTPESGFTLSEEDVQAAASLTTILSPRTINELRLLAGRSSFTQLANSSRPGVERPSGIFGGNNLNTQDRDEDRLQLVENLAWTVGRHNLKFGLDVLSTKTHINTRFNPNGNFLYGTDDPFEPGDCGDLLTSQVPRCPIDDPYCERPPTPCPGVVGFDDDGDGTIDEDGRIDSYPVVYQLITGEPQATVRDQWIALFAQDSWQATPGLLLDFGLRYDLSTYTLPETARVDSVIPNGGAGRDTDNVAPRFGFTWHPAERSPFVLRGGAGVFYDKIPLGFPSVAAITSGTEIGLVMPQGLTLELTEDVVEEYGIDAIREGLIFPDELILRFSTGTSLDTPYVVQYSLGADVFLGPLGVFHLEGVRALGYHQALMRDLNPVLTLNPLGIPVHRDPGTGSIAAFVTEGRTWYTGATLGWRRGDKNRWLSADYTWSQSLDLGPDPLKGGVSLPPIGPYPPRDPPSAETLLQEKGRSDGDRRHRFVFAGGGPLHLWNIKGSFVLQYGSGLPINVTTGRDEDFNGITTDRPRGVGRNTGEKTPLGPVNELRRKVHLPEIAGLDEPDFLQLDGRLAWPFYFGPDREAEFFLQVFNVFDRFNVGAVEGRVVSRRFGEPLGYAGVPRTLELGLRVQL